MPNIINSRLALPIELTTSFQTFYTVLSGTTIVTVLTLANNTASAVTVTLHLCPNGTSPAGSNILLPSVDIDSYTVANFNFGHVMHPGDTIQAKCSVSSGVALHGTGILIS